MVVTHLSVRGKHNTDFEEFWDTVLPLNVLLFHVLLQVLTQHFDKGGSGFFRAIRAVCHPGNYEI